MEQKDNYILQKDTPNRKAGSIFEWDNACQMYRNEDNVWNAESVENNPEWFQKEEAIFRVIRDAIKARDGVKPPLGIKPLWLHNEERLNELNQTIVKYIADGRGSEMPEEWFEERIQLKEYFRKRKEADHKKNPPKPKVISCAWLGTNLDFSTDNGILISITPERLAEILLTEDTTGWNDKRWNDEDVKDIFRTLKSSHFKEEFFNSSDDFLSWYKKIKNG